MKGFLVSVFVVSVLVAADGAEAQWRAERPYRGLFAGGIGETSQLLTATASLGTGWSKNLVLDPNGGQGFVPTPAGSQFRGGVHTASGVLSYSISLGRAALGATAGTTGQFYSTNENQFVRRDYASVGTSVGIGPVTLHGAASYQPYSLRSMLPGVFEPALGDPAIVDEDFPASRVHYLAYSAGADYSRRISRRMSVVTTYNYDVRESVSGGTNGFRRHSVRGRLTRDIGRGLGVYAGYGYSHARFEGADDEFTHHNIDVGVDFTRSLSLSLSRRTLLSFSTGTAAYRNLAGAFRFRATGSARLSHEMGRTWNASLAYNRGLSFVETWREPVFIDSAVAGVGGMLSRRAQLQFTARALLGGSNSGSYGDAESVSATGGLTVALTRHVSTGLTYVYYRQQFADTLLLAEGFPHEFSGQSIRASVSVWAPLFQRARRP